MSANHPTGAPPRSKAAPPAKPDPGAEQDLLRQAVTALDTPVEAEPPPAGPGKSPRKPGV